MEDSPGEMDEEECPKPSVTAENTKPEIEDWVDFLYGDDWLFYKNSSVSLYI